MTRQPGDAANTVKARRFTATGVSPLRHIVIFHVDRSSPAMAGAVSNLLLEAKKLPSRVVSDASPQRL
jgi:hypothetical protein